MGDHLVEGLNDGRFAVYTKIHHALVDGVSAMRMMRRSLTTDPEDHAVRVPWGAMSVLPEKPAAPVTPGELRGLAEGVLGLGPSALLLARKGLLEQQLTLPVGAPGRSSTCRSAARLRGAQSWPIERFIAVKKPPGDAQRRRSGDVRRRPARLSSGAQSAAGPAVDRDGPGEPA